MTRKVVYNGCYGGFGLSPEAQKMYIELKGKEPKIHTGKSSWDTHYYINEPFDLYDREIERHDPVLVKVVEMLGQKANGDCAKLVIEDVDGRYRIDEYDGYETVITEGMDMGWA